jgi:hypothetical protein
MGKHSLNAVCEDKGCHRSLFVQSQAEITQLFRETLADAQAETLLPKAERDE